MKRRTVVALLLATALAGLTAPAAGAKLPVGEADGVRIIRVKGAIVVVFMTEYQATASPAMTPSSAPRSSRMDTAPVVRPSVRRRAAGRSARATPRAASTIAACRFRPAPSVAMGGPRVTAEESSCRFP